MKIFGSVLFWIVLFLLGALAAQFLLQDTGSVLIRYGGSDYTTSVPAAAAALLGALIVLVLLWRLVTLPFRAYAARRTRVARSRLGDGLLALDRGEYTRAEKLLAQAAADDDSFAASAHYAAARAARERGDLGAANRYLGALGDGQHGLRAVADAEQALREHRPTDALVALDAPSAQPLPPRGLALRAQALAASGRATDAYGLLGSLRKQQALPETELDALQKRWAIASLQEAGDGNALAQRWDGLPKPLRSEAEVALAYAERAASLGWNDAAARSVEEALEARWDESLALRYANLPGARGAAQQPLYQRWLQKYPASPALALALAKQHRERNEWPQAEGHLHRALENGGGAAIWEELGNGYAAAGEHAHAELSYLNALRAVRGQRAYPINDGAPAQLRVTGTRAAVSVPVVESNPPGKPVA